jgi:restriction system protein
MELKGVQSTGNLIVMNFGFGGFSSPGNIGRPMRATKASPELLLQSEIIEFGEKMDQGSIIRVSLVPWLEIRVAIKRDPSILFFFANHPRKFEEFLAATYDKAGWDEVILTPRSNDGGRDVIATKKGYCSIRILDQAKAYSPNHLVTHDDVRSMLGVLQVDSNSSKGVITTTSDFQPTIKTNPQKNPGQIYLSTSR